MTGPAERRSALALTDQSVASLGNFVTNIMLARALSQEHFGAFGLILEGILFFNAIHGALVSYPLSVKGACVDRLQLGRFATASLALTTALGGAVALVTLIVGIAGGRPMLALCASAALLLWQIQETLRRAMLSHLRYAEMIWGDAVSYLGQGAVIALLVWWKSASLELAFLVIALTSAAGAVIQLFQVRPRAVSLRQIIRHAGDFLRYGRYQALNNTTIIVTLMGYQWALAYFHGAAAVAELYAMMIMLKLTNPLLIAVGGLILATSAKALHDSGIRTAWSVAQRYAGLGAIILVPYFALLMLFPHESVRLVHGAQSPYAGSITLLRLLVIAAALTYSANIISAFLGGIHRSRQALWAQIVNVAVSLFVTIPLTIVGGAVWGVSGMVLAIASQLAALLYFLHSARNEEKLEPELQPTPVAA